MPMLVMPKTAVNAGQRGHRAVALLNAALLVALILPSASNDAHAVSKWKDAAPRWEEEDRRLHAYVASSVPAVLEHTGSEAFDAHLRGVQAILRRWGADKHVCDAGLFHSIYGTEGFQGFSLPQRERDAIRGLIGEQSERLCWIFCMVDRSTVDQTVFDWQPSDATNTTSAADKQYTFLARPELGRFPISLKKEEWVDFVELTLADWLEQVQGAAETPSSLFEWKAGEAYSYRRTAYAKMADVLAHERTDRLARVVKDMVADVYGTEGSGTRHLVQPRTPPMSEAAERALEALRSAGEDLPTSYAPRPLDDDLTCDSAGGKNNVELHSATLSSNVYETDDMLGQYLGLHFPLSGGDPIIDHANAPVHALRFPQRVADLLISLNPTRTNNRALDVGCAVGGSSFELAKSFDHVEAFDFSANFISAAKRIQSGEDLTFKVRTEGDLYEEASVILEPGVDTNVMGRVTFFRGDACALLDYAKNREGFGTFDGVVMANLLCRLPNPARALGALPSIVNGGGVVLIVTPFTWLAEYTAKDEWLGGFNDADTQRAVFSKDGLRKMMEGLGFDKVHEEQMPLVIKEHRRKYQYIVSEATGWRKR